jgi:DNA-binding transcriptional MerR regulator
MEKDLTIGKVGSATGTKVETIRYYERIGLLAPPGRTAGNYRSYRPDHIRRLSFIRHARGLGFSIAEVQELLDLSERRDASCAEVDHLVARHLATVEMKIASLRRLRSELRNTLAACKGGRISECKVIRALSPRLNAPRTG